MKLNVLLENHNDTKTLGDFLKKFAKTPILTELRNDNFENECLSTYNKGLITPQECLTKHLNTYAIFASTAQYLILNAINQGSVLIPIGSTYTKDILSQDYINIANNDMEKNIKEKVKEYKLETAVLIIGKAHKELINKLMENECFSNLVTN